MNDMQKLSVEMKYKIQYIAVEITDQRLIKELQLKRKKVIVPLILWLTTNHDHKKMVWHILQSWGLASIAVM